MAARFRIIILERLTPGTFNVRFVLWADVPANHQAFYANAEAKSAWPGADAGDTAALASGAVLERVDTLAMDTAASNAAVRQSLQERWTLFQAGVNADTTHSFYGSTWDGTTWVPAGA
jgi:hypothetical protein